MYMHCNNGMYILYCIDEEKSSQSLAKIHNK